MDGAFHGDVRGIGAAVQDHSGIVQVAFTERIYDALDVSHVMLLAFLKAPLCEQCSDQSLSHCRGLS